MNGRPRAISVPRSAVTVTVTVHRTRRDARTPAPYIPAHASSRRQLHTPVTILAIAAHRDDVELTCGGTLIKAAQLGQRTAILDLTQGEMGTRGSAELRRRGGRPRGGDHRAAARERTSSCPTPRSRTRRAPARLLARAIRRYRPRVVIAPPLEGRHPDHRVVGAAHPRRLLPRRARQARAGRAEAPAAQDRARARLPAGLRQARRSSSTSPTSSSRRWRRCAATTRSSTARSRPARSTRTASRSTTSSTHHAATYGSLIRTRYGEPFFTTEMMRVDDVGSLEVATF